MIYFTHEGCDGRILPGIEYPSGLGWWGFWKGGEIYAIFPLVGNSTPCIITTVSPTEIHARRESLELELAQMEQQAARKSALLEAYKLVESDIAGSVIQIPAKVPVPAMKGEITPPLFLRPREGDQPTQLVRRAIADMTTKFTLREILARLELLGTPLDADRISIVLSRLAKTGELKVFEQGVGRRATQYAPPLTPAMEALLG